MGSIGGPHPALGEREAPCARSHAVLGGNLSRVLDRDARYCDTCGGVGPSRIDHCRAPFPFRSEIILISFTVILVTLVLQGLSLPPIIRLLRVQEEDDLKQEETLAREHAATAALVRLDQVATETWVVMEQVERVRLRYLRRLERLSKSSLRDEDAGSDTDSFQRLQHEAFTAERRALIGLRNDGTISDDVLHHLEQELDVASLHLGVGERRMGRARS
jgi:hypothetical protein